MKKIILNRHGYNQEDPKDIRFYALNQLIVVNYADKRSVIAEVIAIHPNFISVKHMLTDIVDYIHITRGVTMDIVAQKVTIDFIIEKGDTVLFCPTEDIHKKAIYIGYTYNFLYVIICAGRMIYVDWNSENVIQVIRGNQNG
jgi:hypothetical protein